MTLTTPDLLAQDIVAVIPAYNERRFIGSVVLETRRYCRAVIVVDDGSSDGTAELAEQAGAEVIRHASNLGKGAAVNTALRAAIPHHPAVVVMLDADGQHAPGELLHVAEPILSGAADLVIGSRYLAESTETPRHRVWGHRLFNTLTGLASGITISDSQSGFRAFSPRVLERMSFQSQGFSVESEMQFLVRKYDLRVVEVPVTITYPDKPKRNVLLHGANVLNGLVRLVLQYRPLFFFGVSGGILLAAGLAMGAFVVEIYSRTLTLAVGYAMISVLLTILGSLLLVTGFILHTISDLLLRANPPGGDPGRAAPGDER